MDATGFDNRLALEVAEHAGQEACEVIRRIAETVPYECNQLVVVLGAMVLVKHKLDIIASTHPAMKAMIEELVWNIRLAGDADPELQELLRRMRAGEDVDG